MKTGIKVASVGALVLLLAGCGASGNGADGDGDWEPGGTVELIVGAGPGGGSDIIARNFASGFEGLTGGNIVVENQQPVEAEFGVFSETGNAEKIGVGNWASMIAHPHELETGYTWDDFTQLAIVAADINYFVTAPGAFDSAEDLVEAGSERTLTVAQVGTAGGHEVVIRDMAEALDIDLRPVGFDGAGDQMNAVIAGDVDLAFLSPGAFMPYVESGDVEAILSTGTEEYLPEELSDVAVPADLGVDREFPVFWRNFFAPPEIGEAEEQYWLDALESWTETDAYDEYLEENYLLPEFVTGDELAEQMEQDNQFVQEGSEE